MRASRACASRRTKEGILLLLHTRALTTPLDVERSPSIHARSRTRLRRLLRLLLLRPRRLALLALRLAHALRLEREVAALGRVRVVQEVAAGDRVGLAWERAALEEERLGADEGAL